MQGREIFDPEEKIQNVQDDVEDCLKTKASSDTKCVQIASTISEGPITNGHGLLFIDRLRGLRKQKENGRGPREMEIAQEMIVQCQSDECGEEWQKRSGWGELANCMHRQRVSTEQQAAGRPELHLIPCQAQFRRHVARRLRLCPKDSSLPERIKDHPLNMVKGLSG